MRGYKLAEKLRTEANEVALEDRAELMRAGAKEIEALIQEYRQATEERDKLRADLAAAQASNAAMREALGAKPIKDMECTPEQNAYWASGFIGAQNIMRKALAADAGKGWVKLNWRPGTEIPEVGRVYILYLGLGRFAVAERDGKRAWMHSEEVHWLYASELLGKDSK